MRRLGAPPHPTEGRGPSECRLLAALLESTGAFAHYARARDTPKRGPARGGPGGRPCGAPPCYSTRSGSTGNASGRAARARSRAALKGIHPGWKQGSGLRTRPRRSRPRFRPPSGRRARAPRFTLRNITCRVNTTRAARGRPAAPAGARPRAPRAITRQRNRGGGPVHTLRCTCRACLHCTRRAVGDASAGVLTARGAASARPQRCIRRVRRYKLPRFSARALHAAHCTPVTGLPTTRNPSPARPPVGPYSTRRGPPRPLPACRAPCRPPRVCATHLGGRPHQPRAQAAADLPLEPLSQRPTQRTGPPTPTEHLPLPLLPPASAFAARV